MKRPDIIIIGAGNRGTGYADYIAAHPRAARVVGVAEPRDFHRERVATKHGIAPENCARSWTEMAKRKKFADAVIIATQDAMHVAPAIAFARLGYDILLEKPLATSESDCRKLAREVRKAGVLCAVCHVMRYTAYTQKMKALLDRGLVGDIVSIDHHEPVGYWHQAHSYVRGNWRNEAKSSPMLLAKSCHDLDWLSYMVGQKCERVHSFGSLKHFRKAEKPRGAGTRCLDCKIEKSCPYSAKRFYLGLIKKGRTGWPLNVLAENPTRASITAALRDGPYGRCVYSCDNDVVDHQVVNMEFAGGRTASFTMTAFCEAGHRKTRIFGTRGSLIGDGVFIEHFDFLSNKKKSYDTRAPDGTIAGGHGGGDEGIAKAFLVAVATGDKSKVISGIEESLESHLMVFAAERSRKRRIVAEVRA